MAERTEATPLEPWESRLTAALVMALQPERARRREEREQEAGVRVSFAEELDAAMRAMRDDIVKLPADVGEAIRVIMMRGRRNPRRDDGPTLTSSRLRELVDDG